jgi:hypothetical protein
MQQLMQSASGSSNVSHAEEDLGIGEETLRRAVIWPDALNRI